MEAPSSGVSLVQKKRPPILAGFGVNYKQEGRILTQPHLKPEFLAPWEGEKLKTSHPGQSPSLVLSCHFNFHLGRGERVTHLTPTAWEDN